MPSKVDPETCAKEFARLCSARRILTDEAQMQPEALKSFQESKAEILRLMASGKLTISQAGDAVYTPTDGKPLTFYPATGAMLMEQDGFGPNENVHRMVAVATAMTKAVPGAIAALPLDDFRAVDDITGFFLLRS